MLLLDDHDFLRGKHTFNLLILREVCLLYKTMVRRSEEEEGELEKDSLLDLLVVGSDRRPEIDVKPVTGRQTKSDHGIARDGR